MMLGRVERAYVQDGLRGVEVVCKRFRLDISLVDVIEKNEYGEWDKSLLQEPRAKRPIVQEPTIV